MKVKFNFIRRDAMQITEINVEKISTENRKRTADAEKVAELSKSIQEIGLLNPITIKKDGDNYILIAGLHRLTAFKSLKKTTIPAIISDVRYFFRLSGFYFLNYLFLVILIES